MRRVVIGVGANLGEPRRAVAGAFAALARVPGLAAGRASSVLRTVPVGGPPQPDYANAAWLAETDLSPRAILDALAAIELEHGRVRAERDAPRTLDLDLLWVEGEIVDEPDLVVPHPRLRERAFALVPLVEVCPDARDPRDGEPFVEVLARVGASGVVPWRD